MKYSSKYGLLPADRIIEPIFQTGITKHHAIYLGADHRGTEWVAENDKFEHVRLVSASNYFKRGKLIKVKQFKGSGFERMTAVKRALSELGKPYDLINYNCEHFAEYVQSGERKSKQVENVAEMVSSIAAAAMIVLLINAFIND